MSNQVPLDGLISFQKEKGSRRIEVDLHRLPELKRFDSVDCHIVFFPHDERIASSEYRVLPFEEYVKNVTGHFRSAYSEIRTNAKGMCGIVLGILVFLIVLQFTHSDIITIESMVAIFAAYFIGKDLWDDLEGVLQRMTRGSLLKYRESDFRYRIDKNSTLHAFNAFARKKQHRQDVVYPELMDFIKRSQSSTIRLRFSTQELDRLSGESAYLLTIVPDKRRAAALEKKGYMIGVKSTFSKRFLGVSKSIDVYQSQDLGKAGCQGDDGNWLPNTAFTRTHLSIGRWRLTLKTGYLKKVRLVKRQA